MLGCLSEFSSCLPSSTRLSLSATTVAGILVCHRSWTLCALTVNSSAACLALLAYFHDFSLRRSWPCFATSRLFCVCGASLSFFVRLTRSPPSVLCRVVRVARRWTTPTDLQVFLVDNSIHSIVACANYYGLFSLDEIETESQVHICLSACWHWMRMVASLLLFVFPTGERSGTQERFRFASIGMHRIPCRCGSRCKVRIRFLFLFTAAQRFGERCFIECISTTYMAKAMAASKKRK